MFDLDAEILKFLRKRKCGGSISFLSEGKVTMLHEGKFYVGDNFDDLMIKLLGDNLDIIEYYVPTRDKE